MTVVGLIPARADSRRVPNKALQPIDGLPLIAHTCRAARESGIFSAVYVNTDCAAIANAASEHGVACPALRPKELAADDTPTRDAVLWSLHELQQRGESYDAIMILQPTSPLRTAEDIRSAWDLFEDNAPCAVVAVSPVAPETWLGRIGRDGSFQPGSGNETLYRLNGAIYIHAWDDYVAGASPRKTIAYVMPATRGVDIDTEADLEYARFLAQWTRQPAAVV